MSGLDSPDPKASIYTKISLPDFLKTPGSGDENAALFSFSDQIKKLGEGLELISNELKSQVRQHHGALLSQASHAGRLDSSLNSVDVQMKLLVRNANQISEQVDGPYAVLEQQTEILTRVHEASYLMRQAGKFLELYGKLKLVKEFPKQALIFQELDRLIEDDPSLAKISFIRDEIVAVQAARKTIINLADKELIRGLRAKNRESVLSAVHILYNLGILETFFNDRLETFVLDVGQAIKECFTAPETKIGDAAATKAQKGPAGQSRPMGPGKAPTLTTNLNFRNKLWLALEWLFNEEIFDYAQQIEFLFECVGDSAFVTSTSFNLKANWWEKLGVLLKESFAKAPHHILQCLQEGLPQLTSITKNMVQKLNLEYSAVFSSLYQSLNPGYVEKCSATLKASLNNGPDLPKEEHLNGFMRLASAALNAALVDEQLIDLVGNVVISCNKDLSNRLESHVKLGTDASQIFDVPNGAQLQNIAICNLIHHHEQNLKQFVGDLQKGSGQAGKTKIFDNILRSLSSARNLSLAIVKQLTDAINSSVADILVSMHREPGLNTNTSAAPSLYMKELNDFLSRVWTSHLQPFADKEVKETCGRELANRCIELFVRNAAILRPLTATGRNKLKVDAQFLESAALKPIVANVSSIGRMFRTLRAFQSVVVMSVEELATQNLEPDTPVPAYIVLLLMFSHAGQDLVSPHVTAGWTIEKLLKWLDGGNTADRDRFELISGTLLRYRNDIRKKNLSQYDPVYPVISNCLERAYQARK